VLSGGDAATGDRGEMLGRGVRRAEGAHSGHGALDGGVHACFAVPTHEVSAATKRNRIMEARSVPNLTGRRARTAARERGIVSARRESDARAGGRARR